MGQYIDLALLLKNSNVIEASNQQKNSIVQGQLVIQQKQPSSQFAFGFFAIFSLNCSLYCFQPKLFVPQRFAPNLTVFIYFNNP
jgi:hypothetical protein